MLANIVNTRVAQCLTFPTWWCRCITRGNSKQHRDLVWTQMSGRAYTKHTPVRIPHTRFLIGTWSRDKSENAGI